MTYFLDNPYGICCAEKNDTKESHQKSYKKSIFVKILSNFDKIF